MAITTFCSHFFANYMNIFHKTEVQTVILRCQMGLNLIWFKNYDPKRKFFRFRFFCDFVKNKACKKTPLLHNVFFLFFNWVKTFEPIMIQNLSAPQNDPLNLSFLKDILVVLQRVVKWPFIRVKLEYLCIVASPLKS